MNTGSGRKSRRELPTVEIYGVIELADELIDDIQAEVEACDLALSLTKGKADRSRAHPRRVGRIYSEGGVDALEEAFIEAAEDEEDGRGGGSGGGGGYHAWQAREKLIRFWENMRADTGYRDALLNMRHDVRRARETLRNLQKRAKDLRRDWQTAYDAMADLQNAMADGMSAVRVEKIPNWTKRMSFSDRVRELRAIADAATGKTYQVTPTPDGPKGRDED